jgi:hypothetical protein
MTGSPCGSRVLFGKPVSTRRVEARGHAFPGHALIRVAGTSEFAFGRLRIGAARSPRVATVSPF